MVIDKPHGRAFILMTVGCLLSVILSALVRRLDLSLSPISIAFYRSLLGLILLMPAMLKTPAEAWGVAKIRFYLLRGTLSAIATLSLFYGLKGVPLAAATALGYTGPIIGAFLVPMLVPHARLSSGHWASIIVGFIGVLIVTHPRGGAPMSYSLAIIMSAAALAAYNILIARAGVADGTVAILFWSASSSTLLLGMAMMLVGLFNIPSLHQLAALGLIALVAVLANLAVASAYRIGHPGRLMPLAYLGLPFAAIIGAAFMKEPISLATIAGGLAIVAAALWGSKGVTKSGQLLRDAEDQ